MELELRNQLNKKQEEIDFLQEGLMKRDKDAN